MKNSTLPRLFTLVTVALCALTAMAYDFVAEGLCYIINSDGETVTLT